jgi:heme-degrading monooxygenase HmoA
VLRSGTTSPSSSAEPTPVGLDATAHGAAPVYAVVFTSRLSADSEGYEATSERMVELCARQPGFVSVESVRDADGRGITVCLWESLDAIAAWRDHAQHAEARSEGARRWYEEWDVMICEVLDRPS